MFISVRQHSFKINEEYHNGSYILHFLCPNPKYNDLFECILNNKLDKNNKLIYFFSKCFN